MFLKLPAVCLIGVSLTGCANMGPPQEQPVRPVLSCADCNGLTYYGPQTGPAPDPRVQMAGVIAKGVTSVAGIAAGAYAATDIASTIAGAGSVVFGPGSTTTTQTVETVHPEVVTTDVAVPVEPVIVNPEVVKPEVVKPEVVNPVSVGP